MAAKPPKPPTNNIYDNQQSKRINVISSQSSSSTPLTTSPESDDNSISNNSNFQQKKINNSNIVDCSCTNISIMQLFHEMKQEFPTVPDHIVNQCVIDNCHDRETCIENLKHELASHPNPVQSYPAQILRNNQNQISNFMCNNKVLLKPTRPAPVPKVNKGNNRNNNSNNFIKNKCDVNNSKNHETNKISGGSACDMQKRQQVSASGNDIENQQQQVNLPQRPTTLSFREPLPQTGGFGNGNQNQQKIIHKPVRRAPLPPTCKPQYSQSQHQSQLQSATTPASQPTVTNCPNSSDHSYSSASVQSPLSFSDSGESEISVNISLSPSSERARGGAITRRTTSITVQPDPPYTRDFTPQSPRSFTSLNLILRKPSTTPQSPIDITAGPGLTYSSSSFDARRGYQKSFHITVTDQGGTFSASRIRPKTNYNVPTTYQEQEMTDTKLQPSQQLQYSQIDDTSIVNEPYTNENYYVYSPQQDDEAELLQRQRNRKDTLARCLQKNKQKLERVQNEIKVLTLPVIPGESERLDSEIERLRCDCQNILQEIENTKRIGMCNTTSIDYHENEQIGERGVGVEQQRLQYPQPPNVPYHLYHPPSAALNYQPLAPVEDLMTIAPRQRPMTTTVMLNQQQQQYVDETNTDGGPPWTCSMCTFQNHPLLNKCECCDNVRQIPGTDDDNIVDVNMPVVECDSQTVFDLPNNSAMPNIFTNINNDNDIAAHFVYLPFGCNQNHGESNSRNDCNSNGNRSNDNTNNNENNSSTTTELPQPHLIS